ncbi:hypothetical protein ACM66B_006304 [Microbotryomycetes sp. NB124-2]
MPASSSSEGLLDQLKGLRVKNVHDPRLVVEIGQQLLERRFALQRGEQVWTVLEQIGAAAAECGQFDLAEVCASRLDSEFPDSPRVALLLGAIAEAKGDTDVALGIYNREIKKDATNTAARKRVIAMHLHSIDKGKSSAGSSATSLSKSKGIDMLVSFLDTFYNDTDAWAQLAQAYQSMQLYSQSLSALSHLLLLAPYNPFYLLWHAETAYTLHDYPLAYKEFLRVIELSDGVQAQGGVGRRAAIGVKLCLTKIYPSTSATDSVSKPTRAQNVNVLMTKMLIKSQEHLQATTKSEMREWLGGEAVVR